MSDFVVRIDTAKLNEKQAGAIASAIQVAVVAELGKVDLARDFGGTPAAAISLHPEWRGYWLRSLKDLQEQKQQVLTVQAR
jgi:hypothetical protein